MLWGERRGQGIIVAGYNRRGAPWRTVRARGIEPECRQSRQARCGHRSCPAIEMVGAALKALRKIQYFLPGTGELTRFRGLTQHAGDLSIMLGTGHSRRVYHWRQTTTAHRICVVPDRRRTRLRGRSLWITPTPWWWSTAPIGGRIMPPDAPATVGGLVRHAAAPMPVAPTVLPVAPVPAPSAASGDLLDWAGPRQA
jgi:hypothetical protein